MKTLSVGPPGIELVANDVDAGLMGIDGDDLRIWTWCGRGIPQFVRSGFWFSGPPSTAVLVSLTVTDPQTIG